MSQPHASQTYSVRGKSLDRLLADIDSQEVTALGGATYEIVNAAIAVETARTQRRWARVSGLASIASVCVAIAAVVVAAVN